MHIPFDKMPDSARLWIYQSDGPMTEKEEEQIKDYTASFLEEWAAHGAGLNSSYQILYKQFLIIAVDEAVVSASGCSIDKQVQFIQAIGDKFSLNFLDRTKVAFLKQNDHSEPQIILSSLQEVKGKVAAGEINRETPTFNNLINAKAELDNNWIVPATDTWLKRYF